MSYRSKYSDGTSRSTRPEADFTSPGLAVMGVERLLISGKAINSNADEVYPNLYIGNMDIAENCSEIYDGMGITYMGIEAHDSPTYDMSVNFNKAAEFIHTALKERQNPGSLSCWSESISNYSFGISDAETKHDAGGERK